MALEEGFWVDEETECDEDEMNACLLCWGPTGDQPAAGNKGRQFFDTTTKRLYYDDGTNWQEITRLDHGGYDGLGDDDHTQYQKESEKASADGYASLDGDTLIPFAQFPTGTGASQVAIGNHTH